MRFLFALFCLTTTLFSVAAASDTAQQCSVRESQATLKALGHDVGTVDGAWGPASARAVSAFQKKEGLVETGALDTATCSQLDKARKAGNIDISKHLPASLGWPQLEGCSYLGDRKLDNRLFVNQGMTMPLDGKPMALASGAVNGGPYDAMGVGTYVQIGGATTICGVKFLDGGLTVTQKGFRLDPNTRYEK